MLSKVITEKLALWSRELDETRKKIGALSEKKEKAAAAVQAALQGRDPDEVIAARQAEARLDEELQALTLIENEILKHGRFRNELSRLIRLGAGGMM